MCTRASDVLTIPFKTLDMSLVMNETEPKPDHLVMESLKSFNFFETDKELNYSSEILSKLNGLAKQWIKETSVSKNMLKIVGGQIYTFGSYRLGVHLREAKIDAVCVVPRHIRRSDYFTSFLELLNQQEEITDLKAVKEAFVPVIKMNFGGIKIDLLFAKLSLTEIPDSMDLGNDLLLKNMDPRCVRSLTGRRVADEILCLVPNVENFTLSLKVIKLWAKKNGIYSDTLGYLGDLSWAILVARTCQLYPDATVASMIEKFFLVFSEWDWSEPVLLKQMDDINLGFVTWNSRVHISDGYQLMPIITPKYPQQNSAINVTSSTRKIIQEAFEAGLETSKEIRLGHATWDDLFHPPNFFGRYKHYLVLLACSMTPEDQIEWCDLIEAQIRCLIESLERNPNIKLAHVDPEPFSFMDPEKDKQCTMWFIGLTCKKNSNVNLTSSVVSFVEKVERQADRINAYKPGMTIDIKHSRDKDLNTCVTHSRIRRQRKTPSG